jgi:hypothetical protein
MRHWQLTETDLVAAVEYNFGKYGIGRVQDLYSRGFPQSFWDRYPGLVLDPSGWDVRHDLDEARDFCYAVAEVQDLAPEDGLRVDGKLGPRTLAYIFSKYLLDDAYTGIYVQDRLDGGWDHQREGVAVVRTILHDSKGGIDLSRKTSSKSTKSTHVCLHWGGWDPRQLGKYFRDTDRAVSSHGGVGYVDGQIEFWQYADLTRKTWHGGWANDLGPGIDLCWQVRTQAAGTLARRYPYLSSYANPEINPSGRGDDMLLCPPEELIRAFAETAVVIAHLLGVPKKMAFPEKPFDVFSKEQVKNSSGIIMHSQWRGDKWDLAPFGREIEEEVNSAASRLYGV